MRKGIKQNRRVPGAKKEERTGAKKMPGGQRVATATSYPHFHKKHRAAPPGPTEDRAQV